MKVGAARRMPWGLLAFGVVLAGAGFVLSALNGERGGCGQKRSGSGRPTRATRAVRGVQ